MHQMKLTGFSLYNYNTRLTTLKSKYQDSRCLITWCYLYFLTLLIQKSNSQRGDTRIANSHEESKKSYKNHYIYINTTLMI